MSIKKRIVLISGLTGGHTYPLLALAERLKEKELLLVVEKRQDFFNLAIKKVSVPAAPFKFSLVLPFKLLFGILKSLFILRRFRADIVFSLGGYLSVPVVMAAALLRIKIVIHEPNLYPGKANLLAARWAHKITLGWEESKPFFPEAQTLLTGIPVREEILKLMDQAKPFQHRILVLGGSQGSRFINDTILQLKDQISAQITHITGKANFDKFKELAGPNYEVYPYLEDIWQAYLKADLLISRAGASTLAEIMAVGIPSILIPYPYASDDHQTKNANVLALKGGAILLAERDLSADALKVIIEKLLNDKEKLKKMSEASRALFKPDALVKILEVLKHA